MIYTPGGVDLSSKAIPIDVIHQGEVSELEAHSVFGHLEGKATYEFYKEHGTRGFILSRSTYMGSGKFVQHWLGDNYATFEHMRYSVSGIYQFNLYGIPVVGADVCGFNGPTNPELCTRWYQLAVFYPFA